ncbi:hypothetical protein [Mycoplasma sp. 'Moose RK']|uniref:hypothetical protein n=1 Tax=Mycoplasma sp. 'Moose RK' TaxID=2780095 RepID=UPI0018C32CE2|nr:hypothetical protein [Mycoplasma sp. 'Moose RK']MBG0731013.1 hypothetical protein [Mycoplasma sp. 'Moose RK']
MLNNSIPEKLFTLSENQINRILINFQKHILEDGWVTKSDFVKLIKQNLEEKKIDISVASGIINGSGFLFENEWVQIDKSFNCLNFAKNKYQLLEFFLKEKIKEDSNVLNNISLPATKDNLFLLNRKFPFDSKYINLEGRLEALGKETKKFIIDQLIKTVISDLEIDKNSKLFFSFLDEAENFGNWKSTELAKIEGIEIEINEDINFVKKENDNFFDFAKSNIEIVSKFLKNNNSIEYIFSKFYENKKETEFEKNYIFALIESLN